MSIQGGDDMRTAQRLCKAWKEAPRIPLDDASKFVILSDCHRGDGSASDEFARNQNIFIHALRHYYDEGYTYIEAGDGDELWEHHNFRHIKNAYFDVFKIIKRFYVKDRLILIWGNHNNYLRDSEYVKKNYFCYYHEHQRVARNFLNGIEPKEAVVLRHTGTG